MTITPYDFDAVKIIGIPFPISGPPGPTIVGFHFIITGYAMINFPGNERNPVDWVRAEVEFSLGPKISKLWESSMIAFPATFETLQSNPVNFGWGVDNAFTTFDEPSQMVVAHVLVVAKTAFSNILRIGFQINIAGQK